MRKEKQELISAKAVFHLKKPLDTVEIYFSA